MKTPCALFVGVVSLVAAAVMPLAAKDPQPPARKGNVLVLVNERTLEGDIERQGDQFRVRRAIGETWIPGNKALALCQNFEEAYQFLKTQANLEDPDERRRLAQWCMLNGLRKQALDEMTAAVELRPNDADSRRLLRNMQRSAINNLSAGVGPAAERIVASGPLQSAPGVDLNADSLNHFINKVQPILMNACAGCHSSGRESSFQLTRTVDRASTNKRTSQQNAAAAIMQLTPGQVQGSPLLLKAVSAHGGASQAPLRGKQTPAYRTLEDWVTRTINDSPQLQAAGQGALSGSEPSSKPASSVFAEVRTTAMERQPTRQPTPAPGVIDPFDPAIFNRQMHGEDKAKEKPSVKAEK